MSSFNLNICKYLYRAVSKPFHSRNLVSLSSLHNPSQKFNTLSNAHQKLNSNKYAANKALLFLTSSRSFNYDHWYKVDKERDRRVNEKVKEKLKKKSIWKQAKYVYDFGINGMNEFLLEIKERFSRTPK